MALKGSFSGKTSNDRITPTISWAATQSVTGNYSDITATLTYKRNNNYNTEGSWKGSLTIGTQTFTGSKWIKITGGGDAVAISATARVGHDDQGKLTLTVSATGAISGSTLTSTTISGDITLDTIARASTVSAANAPIGSRATVVVSRKSAAFTHSLRYQFGTLTGYVDAEGDPVEEEVKLTATTVNFLLPEGFYGQIPNAPSGVCTLTCRTYSGNDRIGADQTGKFTVTAPEEDCKPLVDGSVRDVNPVTVALTGDDSVLVRYASVARCEIEALPRNGATIVQKRIGGVLVEEDALEIENAAFDTVDLSATDSRGYTTAFPVMATQILYVPLTNNATVQRTDPTSGNAVLTLQGNCWNGNFGAEENTLMATVSIEGEEQFVPVTVGQDHKYTATVSLSNLDYTRAYTVEVTVADKVMSVPCSLPVQKGIPVFDWGEEDFQFHVPVDVAALSVGGVPLKAYIQSIIAGGS